MDTGVQGSIYIENEGFQESENFEFKNNTKTFNHGNKECKVSAQGNNGLLLTGS